MEPLEALRAAGKIAAEVRDKAERSAEFYARAISEAQEKLNAKADEKQSLEAALEKARKIVVESMKE